MSSWNWSSPSTAILPREWFSVGSWHRIGRTARAGAGGIAISFCCGEDRENLSAIERLIGKKLVVKEHKYSSTFAQNGGMMKSTTKEVKTQAKTGKGGGRSKLTSVHKARQSGNWKQK